MGDRTGVSAPLMNENLASFVAASVESALVEYDPGLRKPAIEAGGLCCWHRGGCGVGVSIGPTDPPRHQGA
jgi:hypothetical protein